MPDQIDGFIPIDKLTGMTSHDVVNCCRKILKTKKIGHTGTLDPEATGVLVLCVGRGTKLIPYLTEKQKIYEAEVVFGVETDTLDMTGKVQKQLENFAFSAEDLRAVIPGFTGCIMQVPPMYSALKKDGKKLYEYAREGVDLDIPPRPVEIKAIDIVDDADLPKRAMLKIHCGQGTYIRSLCRDIGQALGIPSSMGALRRLRSGMFDIGDTVTLEKLSILAERNALSQVLSPLEKGVSSFARATANERSGRFLRSGNALYQKNIVEDLERFNDHEYLRLYDGETFCGIGQYLADDESRIKPLRILV